MGKYKIPSFAKVDKKSKKIALMHDWFNHKSLGGAEYVTEILDKYFTKKLSKPQLFSIVENISNSKLSLFSEREIKTSFIQNLPLGRSNVQTYLPIIPLAVEQLDFSEYDLIFSSSHAAAKGLLSSPEQLHISYIHTPMRYAWDQMNTYLSNSTLCKFGLEPLIRYSLHKLREWDYISGKRPDYLIANSTFTSKRIKKYWGLDSKIINPPVNIKRFNPNKNRGDFYLTVNRLVPNKRTDLLIKSFNKLKLPLFIVGEGPEKEKLKRIANPNIRFLGRTSNLKVEELMSTCRAFVYAGIEDFGIAPVEAMASGAPIIALGKGGILDTVNCFTKNDKNNISNGILFKEQNCKSIYDAVNWFEENKLWKKFISTDLNFKANEFCVENFIYKLDNFLEMKMDEFY